MALLTARKYILIHDFQSYTSDKIQEMLLCPLSGHFKKLKGLLYYRTMANLTDLHLRFQIHHLH